MPFSKNNLPSSSLPWGREVENQIEALKDTVYKNEINNSARDATNQTNIKNINSVLSNQLELKTYFAEVNPNITRSKTYTGTGFGNLDTSDLSITVTLTKPRTLVLQYSSLCRVRNTFITANESYSWYVTSEIYVNGTRVSYSDIQKERNFTTGNNPYSSEYDSQQMVNIKRVKLFAGTHNITVKVDTGAVSTTATTQITVSGDDLSVTIIE